MHKTRQFWEMHPAFLGAVSLLLGIGLALFQLSGWLVLPFGLYIVWLRKWASLVLLVFGALYAFVLYAPPITPLSCTARFSIASLQERQTPFHKNWAYSGTLYLENAAIPCKVSHAKSPNRPLASQDYYVTGTLEAQDAFSYHFKAKQWTPIPRTWSPAEFRFQIKEKIRIFLQSHLHRPKTASFLVALATGNPPDRQIVYEFGRLGLQHLLAISGFHFGILMAFISMIFRFFPSGLWKWGLLLSLMTVYFVFIGTAPAVQRAWIGAFLFILAKILRRQIIPLNILGAALLIELLWNPLAVANLGFQFSFGSCFGILWLYQPIEKALRKFFPKRKAQEAFSLPLLAQIAYFITSSLRRSLSLTVAVNLAILPLLLFHFGKFPLLSLFYNLFFPPLVAIALISFLFSTIVVLLTGCNWGFFCLDWFCGQLLDLTAYPPLFLDRAIYCKDFPFAAIFLYFFGLIAFRFLKRNAGELRTS